MRKILRFVLLSSMLIISATSCTTKSDNSDSLSLLLLGSLGTASSSNEDLSCQNKTLNWTIRTPAEANQWTSIT